MTKHSFEKLRVKWNKKLLDSGFEDIENMDGTLKKEVHTRTVTAAFKDKEARETYFSMAEDYNRFHDFHESVEAEVWALHCTALSFRRIAKTLKITFYKVRQIVTTHQKLAGLKK